MKIHLNIIFSSTPRSSKCSPSFGSSHHIPVCVLVCPVRGSGPAHLIYLYLVTRFVFGEHRSLCASLCCLFHSAVTSSPLGPSFYLCTVFSNTLSLCSFLNLREQVSHPYKPRGIVTVLYILVQG
jgi:hypothetical protein